MPRHLNSFRRVKTIVFLTIFLLSLNCQAVWGQTQANRQTAPKFDGHEDHVVPLSYAMSLTKNFREATGNDPSTILGEYFGKDALIQALNQEHCVGLRVYYGKQDDGTPALVLVGVDNTGTDMTNGLVLETGWICPPYCGDGTNLSDDNALVTLSTLKSDTPR
jgi:hypothetical protein